MWRRVGEVEDEGEVGEEYSEGKRRRMTKRWRQTQTSRILGLIWIRIASEVLLYNIPDYEAEVMRVGSRGTFSNSLTTPFELDAS